MLYDYSATIARSRLSELHQTWSVSRDHRRCRDSSPPCAPTRRILAYDAFVKQWMEDKVVPEYRVTQAKRLGPVGYEVRRS
jgi:hypothetical protein